METSLVVCGLQGRSDLRGILNSVSGLLCLHSSHFGSGDMRDLWYCFCIHLCVRVEEGGRGQEEGRSREEKEEVRRGVEGEEEEKKEEKEEEEKEEE